MRYRLIFATTNKKIYLTKSALTVEQANMLGKVYAAKGGRYGWVYEGCEPVSKERS